MATNDLTGIFSDSTTSVHRLTAKMVKAAESKLGYQLPASYIELLKIQNGGYLNRRYFPTDLCQRWASNHVVFRQVDGIGGKNGIDSDTGSAYLIQEWSYPNVGIVISSEGDTAFMLDYSKCGKVGGPRVIWVDVETDEDKPYVAVLAPDFATFLSKQLEKEPGE